MRWRDDVLGEMLGDRGFWGSLEGCGGIMMMMLMMLLLLMMMMMMMIIDLLSCFLKSIPTHLYSMYQ